MMDLESLARRGIARNTIALRRVRSAAWAVTIIATAVLGVGCGPGTTANDGGGNEGGGGNDGGGADPCNGVTTGGRCMSAMAYERCLVTTENSRMDTRVVTEACGAGEMCQELEGRARCVATTACREGATTCGSTTMLRTCTSGAWVDSMCPGACEAAAAGAQCVTTAGSRMLSGSFVFQRRRPEPAAMPTDWGAPADAPGRGFLVSVFRGTMLVGSTTSGTDAAMAGQFNVRVPDAVAMGDSLVVTALLRDADGTARIAVADPGLPAGMQMASSTAMATMPTAWSWRFDLTMAPADNIFRVSEAEGSGVANVFDVHAAVYRSVVAHYRRQPAAILIWMGRGVAWDCGACVAGDAFVALGGRFENQEWFIYDNDFSFYSDSVVAHEAGHWIMEAYGRSPGEGGGHNASTPAFPGLAWSDGWATGYSSLVRGDPLYVDKQSGSMFWSNISTRMATTARPRPMPNGMDTMPSDTPGLLQRVGEEEVSAILWSVGGGGMNLGAIYDALASPRMRMVPAGGAFERGYRRHTYDFNDMTSEYSNIVRTMEPAPILPDFLDALLCAGFSREAVDRAVEPMTHYPYPSDRTRCRP